MMDSDGDGWYGAKYTLEHSNGEVEHTGTLADGTTGTHYLCFLPGGCYTMTVSTGAYPDDISWQVIIGGVVEAEGGAGETVGGLCVDGNPTSTPTITVLPTMTSWPTQYEVPPFVPLSALYTGTQRVTQLQAMRYPIR